MYQQIKGCATMQVSIGRPGLSQPALKCRFVAGKRRHAIAPHAAAGNGKGGIGRLCSITVAMQESGFPCKSRCASNCKGSLSCLLIQSSKFP